MNKDANETEGGWPSPPRTLETKPRWKGARASSPAMARMVLIAFLALPAGAWAAAYGSLNNFDVVNDTGQKCYGFSIELDDLHSTDITYTYDYNHFGVPRITEDNSDPAHPKVFVRYEAKKGPDGKFIQFTNPQDPANPLGPTSGHAFTNPSINLGGEHFGVGNLRAPSLAKYHWLIEDPANPGTLVLGPVVNVATPTFVYVPPAPGVPARAQVVIAPPPPEVPEINNIEQFGVPVWVKILKTVQKSGRHVHLNELLPEDSENPEAEDWAGAEPPETEIEWQVFQKRPPSNPGGGDEIEAADDLPNGDETVTRRYEFYAYNGPVNAEDGEAQCSNTNDCPEAIGQFISAQMAGFNVVSPLGLIDHLQEGEVSVPYVDRTVATGGTAPYVVTLSSGLLPDGLDLDSNSGVLTGTPLVSGLFPFTVKVTDADAVSVTNQYALRIVGPPSLTPVRLSIQQGVNPWLVSWPADHTGWRLEIQTNDHNTGLNSDWTTVPGSDQTNQFPVPLGQENVSVFLRLVYP